MNYGFEISKSIWFDEVIFEFVIKPRLKISKISLKYVNDSNANQENKFFPFMCYNT